PATPDAPKPIDAPRPIDAPAVIPPVNLMSNEGGEIRMEWQQNAAGATTARITAFFYKAETPAVHPFPAFPGCVDMRMRDKWPLAQGNITPLDVGNVIIQTQTGTPSLITLTRDASGTTIDPLGRPHALWYKKSASFPMNDGAMLPPNQTYNILLTGSAEWPAQAINKVAFMPQTWNPVMPNSMTPAALVAGTDYTFTYDVATSSNLPPGYTVNNVIGFTSPNYVPAGCPGVMGSAACGPIIICQKEGLDGTITLPHDMVDILRTYTSGGMARQNLTHIPVELTDGTPVAPANRKRLDILSVWCYGGTWTAP
ncbi:MAG: hypothetical protein JWO36_6883, partial [Myxococcales bacterium]|nr:hypothetical protein [Myxococcales bacterium]